MPDTQAQASPVNANVRYEGRDADVGAIVAFGVGLVAVGLILHLAVAWLFDEFKEDTRRADVPLPTLAAEKRKHLPRDLQKIPPPVLQESEIVDLERLRRAEDRQ